MNTLTYKQAYDKIIEAYFKDQIQPTHPCFCFCGTLCNNSNKWFRDTLKKHNNSHGYMGVDFVRMESALFNGICDMDGCLFHDEDTPEYQDDLFNGMSAAIEVLKQIHIERGEAVDEVPIFKKRKLIDAI